MKLVKGRESRLPADPARRRDEARPRFSLISVRKCSQEASASSHTTPIISRPSRHPCVSICGVLFKLWEGFSSVSVLTPLSLCLSVLTVFNSLVEVSLLPCEESWKRRAGVYENNLALLTPCRRRTVGGGMLLLGLFCGL